MTIELPILPQRMEVTSGVWIDSRLALWLAPERILVVADLHWGYAASHRARGNLLPQWGDDEVEASLRSLIADYAPREMIWLGDIVHAAEGSEPAERFLREAKIAITVLAGNHDRRWAGAGTTSATRGRYFFHHGDVMRAVPSDSIEIVGHHHPAFAWSDGAGGRVKVPALAITSRRMVLPAFSPWASGTEWVPEPDATLWVIAPRRIFPVRDLSQGSAAV